MKLLCLKDYNYGSAPKDDKAALPPGIAQLIAALGTQVASGRGKPPAPEEPKSEYLYEFKAGEVYDLPDILATRLYRDLGEIDHMAWRLAQGKSDMPITTPPHRADPTFAMVTPVREPEPVAQEPVAIDLVPAV